MNITELSSRRNISKNNFYQIKNYNPNAIKHNLTPINLKNNTKDNIYNVSSNSSQIKPLHKIQK